jgi:hypothetical protein
MTKMIVSSVTYRYFIGVSRARAEDENPAPSSRPPVGNATLTAVPRAGNMGDAEVMDEEGANS